MSTNSPRPARAVGAAVLAAILAAAPLASAQTPAGDTLPPPGYGPGSPGYGTPPPGYGTAPPTYAPPAPGYGVPGGGYYAQPVPMGPKVMDYEEGDPIPQGYHLEEKRRKGLIIAGAATFGGLWLISVFAAAIAQAGTGIGCSIDGQSTCAAVDNYNWLYMPLAGPWITMATAHSRGAGTFGLGVLGVGQALGATGLILGLAAPQQKLVRDAGLPPALRSWTVTPMVAGGGTGVTLGRAF